MNEQGYVFMRGQQMYHTDQHTYDALIAVKQWAAHSGQDLTAQVFEHGRTTGMIREGAPVHEQEEQRHANPDPAAAAARQGYGTAHDMGEHDHTHEVGFGY
jgi:hypothetical protein